MTLKIFEVENSFKVEYCKKCNTEITGNYCANCGFPRELIRIDKRYLLDEIGSVLYFDKGILYTIKQLIIRPGKAVHQFIREDRRRLVKPIIFLIICSLLYTIAQNILAFEDGYINISLEEMEGTITGKMFNWVGENYGYANIIMALFTAFWIKIFFSKYGYNYYEIFILLCFTMGMSMLIFALLGIADSIFGHRILNKGSSIAIVYSAWAIGQFFDAKKKRSYLKGLVCYLLGMISFFTILIILAIGITTVMESMG